MPLSLVWKTVSFERKTGSSAPLALLKEPWTSERIPPELSDRFATKSFRYKSFRSTVLAHQIGKNIENFDLSLSVFFLSLTFSARHLTSRIRVYSETKNSSQWIHFMMKQNDRLVAWRLCSRSEPTVYPQITVGLNWFTFKTIIASKRFLFLSSVYWC